MARYHAKFEQTVGQTTTLTLLSFDTRLARSAFTKNSIYTAPIDYKLFKKLERLGYPHKLVLHNEAENKFRMIG